MSRSGYSDDVENWQLIRWRGQVASAIRGKRGQAFLAEALAALDALPRPELIPNDLATEGAFCMLGAVGHARQATMAEVDVEDHEAVAALFAIPHAFACEIMWENDEGGRSDETSRARWERMRTWLVGHLSGDQPGGDAPVQPDAKSALAVSANGATPHGSTRGQQQ